MPAPPRSACALPSAAPRGWPRPAASGALCLVAALSLAGSGCREPRRPLPRNGDGGPSVEVVERQRPGAPGAPYAGALIDEHEPDDDREHAQPMEQGKGVRGSLAPPTQAAGKGDDDWYSYLVQAPAAAPAADGGADASAPQELRVQLSSASDVALELLDGDGRRLLQADDHPGGEPEIVGGFSVAAGQTLYLRVRPSARRPQRPQRPAPGKPQVVVTADPSYTLTVTQHSASRGAEAEPNDTAAQATATSGPENLLSGSLHSRKDEDWFLIDLRPLGKAGASAGILRIEAQTPAVVPALRVETAAEPGAARSLLADIKAGGPGGAGGSEDLRVRNLGLPAAAGAVYLGLRAQGWKPAATGARYQMRVVVEPLLEDAEQEPNDQPGQATVLLLNRRGAGGASDGGLSGFLWPGDVDHYRIPVEGPSRLTVQLRLPEGCAAVLAPVAAPAPRPAARPGAPAAAPAVPPIPTDPPVPTVPTVSESEGGRSQTLTVDTADVATVRVSALPQRGSACFDAPYQLSAHVDSAQAPGNPGKAGAP